MIMLASPDYRSRKVRKAADDQQILKMQNELRKEELLFRGVELRMLEMERRQQEEEFKRELGG